MVAIALGYYIETVILSIICFTSWLLLLCELLTLRFTPRRRWIDMRIGLLWCAFFCLLIQSIRAADINEVFGIYSLYTQHALHTQETAFLLDATAIVILYYTRSLYAQIQKPMPRLFGYIGMFPAGYYHISSAIFAIFEGPLYSDRYSTDRIDLAKRVSFDWCGIMFVCMNLTFFCMIYTRVAKFVEKLEQQEVEYVNGLANVSGGVSVIPSASQLSTRRSSMMPLSSPPLDYKILIQPVPVPLPPSAVNITRITSLPPMLQVQPRVMRASSVMVSSRASNGMTPATMMMTTSGSTMNLMEIMREKKRRESESMNNNSQLIMMNTINELPSPTNAVTTISSPIEAGETTNGMNETNTEGQLQQQHLDELSPPPPPHKEDLTIAIDRSPRVSLIPTKLEGFTPTSQHHHQQHQPQSQRGSLLAPTSHDSTQPPSQRGSTFSLAPSPLHSTQPPSQRGSTFSLAPSPLHSTQPPSQRGSTFSLAPSPLHSTQPPSQRGSTFSLVPSPRDFTQPPSQRGSTFSHGSTLIHPDFGNSPRGSAIFESGSLVGAGTSSPQTKTTQLSTGSPQPPPYRHSISVFSPSSNNSIAPAPSSSFHPSNATQRIDQLRLAQSKMQRLQLFTTTVILLAISYDSTVYAHWARGEPLENDMTPPPPDSYPALLTFQVWLQILGLGITFWYGHSSWEVWCSARVRQERNTPFWKTVWYGLQAPIVHTMTNTTMHSSIEKKDHHTMNKEHSTSFHAPPHASPTLHPAPVSLCPTPSTSPETSA